MDSAKLTQSVSVQAIPSSGAAARRTDGAPQQETRSAGLRWTTCGGFDSAVRAVEPGAWADPGGAGWQLVKRNAVREVWRATILGRDFYLKYYCSGGIRSRIKRWFGQDACRSEWAASVYAAANGIAAARPAGFTSGIRRDGRSWSLLVTHAVTPATPLDAFWRGLCSDGNVRRRRTDVEALVETLAELLARAHQSGFEHLDMHAANILVQTVAPRRYRAVFIDLHGARIDAPIGPGAVVRNLAQLNQWFSRHSSTGDRLRFLRAYLRRRHEFEHVFRHARPLETDFRELVASLRRAAQRHAERLWSQRDRRIGRRGRYFDRVTGHGGWQGMVCLTAKHGDRPAGGASVTLERGWWPLVLRDPAALLGTGASGVKDSHSAEVLRTELAHPDRPLQVIIKRPRGRTLWRRLRNALGAPRVARAFALGHALLHRDIATARPLAALQRRIGPWMTDSLLITEVVPGAVDLGRAIERAVLRLDARERWRYKARLAHLLAAELRRFHDRGFVHRDCKAQNLLVCEEPLRLVWIDMDGVRRAVRVTREDERRALARLCVSLDESPGLTRGDVARFLKAYCARFGADVNRWRQMWRAVAPLVRRKAAQRERRTAWKLANYGRR
ncbi:MAG: hypothetical protein HRU75_03820 [Planctomycetia bacterium]|nr:MAG: hypothetical protein HRU75_03820 [Planctomycetia bacterium]